MTDTPHFTIKAASRRWRAFFAGHVIADSADALILQEADHAPVVYFPRDEVSMEYMSRTDRVTHCPFKGEASHYTLLMDGKFAENGVWSYEDPVPGCELIAGRIAFYPKVVELYEVDDERVNPDAHRHDRHDVDNVVRHTDAGDGHAQGGHWPAG
jgi:uncharacterized protein (DUF427 family)